MSYKSWFDTTIQTNEIKHISLCLFASRVHGSNTQAVYSLYWPHTLTWSPWWATTEPALTCRRFTLPSSRPGFPWNNRTSIINSWLNPSKTRLEPVLTASTWMDSWLQVTKTHVSAAYFNLNTFYSTADYSIKENDLTATQRVYSTCIWMTFSRSFLAAWKMALTLFCALPPPASL